jgi:hypothetical protein
MIDNLYHHFLVFSQLYDLYIDISFVNSSSTLHSKMAKICKNLNRLRIYNCTQDLPEMICTKNLKYNY